MEEKARTTSRKTKDVAAPLGEAEVARPERSRRGRGTPLPPPSQLGEMKRDDAAESAASADAAAETKQTGAKSAAKKPRADRRSEPQDGSSAKSEIAAAQQTPSAESAETKPTRKGGKAEKQ